MDNYEFKTGRIKNRTCYYFDDIIKLGFDLDNILIDEKSHGNILIYDISYKILIGPKPLRVRFFKIDGIIRIYDGTRYLTLFGSEKYEAIYSRIRCPISQKSGITYIFSHYFAKIKVDSYDSLHNVIIHIKSVLDKYKFFFRKMLLSISLKLKSNHKFFYII